MSSGQSQNEKAVLYNIKERQLSENGFSSWPIDLSSDFEDIELYITSSWIFDSIV